jgi:triosephosphate isomerase
MRRPFVAGNWKMHTTAAEAAALARAVVDAIADVPAEAVEVAVCPPSVYLQWVRGHLGDAHVQLGAQNLYPEAKGAFTGEISPQMLLDIGCTYCILGHSERRHIMGETDKMIAKKIRAALDAGLGPIFCVGETLTDREQENTFQVIAGQFMAGFDHVSEEQIENVVIAYEPVWAIGTGKTASPTQAEEVHAFIRKLLTERYGEELAQKIRIQYGGSVKPDNARELLSQPNIDGALVGGASLKADDFAAIVRAAVS